MDNFSKYAEQPVWGNFFEPANTLSNFFFIIAGIWMLMHLKKSGKLDGKGLYLSTMLIIIGVGSFAWHLYRTPVTLWMDSGPIMIFVLSYLYFYLAHAEPKLLSRLLLFAGFFVYTPVVATLLATHIPVVFGNDGAGYSAAISYLIVIQLYNYIKGVKIIRQSLVIVGIFSLSLFFRQVDMHATNVFSFGTHFLWHFFNSVTLFMMIRLLYTTEGGKKANSQ